MQQQVYFYPHSYLRDRHLDTIRRWPKEEVINPEVGGDRRGSQVSAHHASAKKLPISWKQKLPFLNIKLRPKGVPSDAVLYIWGGVAIKGDFIVDLDNPWSLVGYNLRTMWIYRRLLKWFLLSDRCLQIRCISRACRNSLRILFGEEVFAKARVHYPCIPQKVAAVERIASVEECRFLFVGTQFEIKGGEALLKAFARAYKRHGRCRLDVITHLPVEFAELARTCNGIHIHEARFSRDEVHNHFMRNADVLILPTYVETFGMVALEALAHGLALIATDVYALNELVNDGENGELLIPPISIWEGEMPSDDYYDLVNIKERIRTKNTRVFESTLEGAIERFVLNPYWRLRARQASTRLMAKLFTC